LPDTPTPAIRNQLLPWEAEALLEVLGSEVIEQAPEFQQAVSGAVNRYSSELAEQLGDRILQQSVATTWRFVAIKSAKSVRPISPSIPPQ
jgi:hypothetical protein